MMTAVWMFVGLLAFVGFFVVIVGLLVCGMHLGLQVAVDDTRKKGHFMAYGKKYVAIAKQDGTSVVGRNGDTYVHTDAFRGR